jgi:hypothetical protein
MTPLVHSTDPEELHPPWLGLWLRIEPRHNTAPLNHIAILFIQLRMSLTGDVRSWSHWHNEQDRWILEPEERE